MERLAWRPHGLLTQGTIFTGDASSIREANTNTQIKSIEDTAPLIAIPAVSGVRLGTEADTSSVKLFSIFNTSAMQSSTQHGTVSRGVRMHRW